MLRGWFDAFRSDGGPTLYTFANRTPVTEDVRNVLIYVSFSTIFVAFLIVFPGIRKENLQPPEKESFFCSGRVSGNKILWGCANRRSRRAKERERCETRSRPALGKPPLVPLRRISNAWLPKRLRGPQSIPFHTPRETPRLSSTCIEKNQLFLNSYNIVILRKTACEVCFSGAVAIELPP
ncbi:dual oxidase maturation factor 2-like [Caerostris extrusa]|uniref:Dual oxidase maturation factor 2-like n=1 Tax=Caerostris extrusa TaxID=172846 RepID=A0AAV4QVF8_CAEEX|nr:dual oxidase maturation factor 2-like [Caerostris extrusa]